MQPDTKLASAYLQTAQVLLGINDGDPSQADMRKSISCSYGAMYHELACMSANMLAGPLVPERSNKAWVEVYRGLSHGSCKDACSKAKNISFPQAILDFSNNFVQLQDARKRADYDPTFRATIKDATHCLTVAKRAISAVQDVDDYDKRAFATWVLITTPGAKQAREMHRHGPGVGLFSNSKPAEDC